MIGLLPAGMTASEAVAAAHDDYSTGAVIQRLVGERDAAQMALTQILRECVRAEESEGGTDGLLSALEHISDLVMKGLPARQQASGGEPSARRSTDGGTTCRR